MHIIFKFGILHSLHPSERIFWLISVVLSVLGVFYLITEYQKDFNTRAVSIVYESISPLAPVKFPSVAICGLPTEQIDILVDYVQRYTENIIKHNINFPYLYSLGSDLSGPYNFAVETYLTFILYPDSYSENLFYYLCEQTKDCAECAKCPLNDYRQIAKSVSAEVRGGSILICLSLT